MEHIRNGIVLPERRNLSIRPARAVGDSGRPQTPLGRRITYPGARGSAQLTLRRANRRNKRAHTTQISPYGLICVVCGAERGSASRPNRAPGSRKSASDGERIMRDHTSFFRTRTPPPRGRRSRLWRARHERARGGRRTASRCAPCCGGGGACPHGSISAIHGLVWLLGAWRLGRPSAVSVYSRVATAAQCLWIPSFSLLSSIG